MEDTFVFIRDNQPIITAITGIISVILIFSSILVAVFTILRAKKNQKEATARNIFNDYLKESFKYPVFAFPERYINAYNFENRLIDKSKDQFEQYEWYVSLMTFTMREILDILYKDRYWVMTARRQLRYHIEYFNWRREKTELLKHTDPEGDFVLLSGRKVNDIIDELLNERKIEMELKSQAFGFQFELDI